MTGVTFPLCMRLLRTVRSCLVSCAKNVTNFWLTNGDNMNSLIGPKSGPVKPPPLGPPPPPPPSRPPPSDADVAPLRLQDLPVLEQRAVTYAVKDQIVRLGALRV